jgi:hypothetical protein
MGVTKYTKEELQTSRPRRATPAHGLGIPTWAKEVQG